MWRKISDRKRCRGLTSNVGRTQLMPKFQWGWGGEIQCHVLISYLNDGSRLNSCGSCGLGVNREMGGLSLLCSWGKYLANCGSKVLWWWVSRAWIDGGAVDNKTSTSNKGSVTRSNLAERLCLPRAWRPSGLKYFAADFYLFFSVDRFEGFRIMVYGLITL
jgi:hypothetical protein